MFGPDDGRPESRVSELLQRAGLAGVSRSALLAIAALAVVGLSIGLWRWSAPAPTLVIGAERESEAHAVSEEAGGPPEGAIPASEASAATMRVHVVGAVTRPGVYELLPGARVAEAVGAAGGLLGSAAEMGVNLARFVEDGEQVFVPTLDQFEAGIGAPETVMQGGATSGTGTAALLDVNTADASQLEALPGIGPATAAKIIADRESGGRFSTVDDLLRVSGIGPKKLEALREHVTVR